MSGCYPCRRRGDGTRGRCHVDLMGLIGRIPIAIAAGLGLLPVVAFSLAPRMTWADAMGLVILEGVLVLVSCSSACARRSSMRSRTAEVCDRRRHRTLHHPHRPGRRGHRAPRQPPHQLRRHGNLSGWSAFVFCFGLLLMSVLVVLKVRGGLPHRHRRDDAARCAARGRLRRRRAQRRESRWLGPQRAGHPDVCRRLPDFSLIGQFNLFGAFAAIGVLAAGLAVFSLMLTDFFDTMGTAFGIAAEATCSTRTTTCLTCRRSSRWTQAQRLSAVRRAHRAIRRTSSRRLASATARAQASPPWSQACCSSPRCSSHRSSPSCPGRLPRQRSSSSAR